MTLANHQSFMTNDIDTSRLFGFVGYLLRKYERWSNKATFARLSLVFNLDGRANRFYSAISSYFTLDGRARPFCLSILKFPILDVRKKFLLIGYF
ncbi:hypothetical protein LCM23_16330 [Cytobacillus kochii]|uniref:hypothetical protein n=1 Tax=Cytobacillus kochii TaxID=859143 RepID=UPI001CD49EA5|nr:hypothetical protein [Cytobacillus kochii]MCA1027667.1 hypothetical protein [Cytobacillus kochii]